jgi:hypothetical protein
MERLREAREMWLRQNEENLDLGLPLTRTRGVGKDMSSVVEWNDVVYDTIEVGKEKIEPPVHSKENLHSHPGLDIAVVLDDPNLGPVGTDCDGLGESAFQTPYITARQRKPIEEEKGESPPSSPLKCNFDFDEIDLGVRASNVSEAKDKGRDIEGGRDADPQLREERASWGSNVLLRRAEIGDERFGDEAQDE